MQKQNKTKQNKVAIKLGHVMLRNYGQQIMMVISVDHIMRNH